MLRSPNYTTKPWQEAYSEIIDVRSESEYAEDRLPGAINLPLLNDEERAKVGILYKQVNPFEARKVGAAIATKNISQHLTTHFATKEKDYHPLIYCWRGGQRSNSFALVLSQIGWNVTVIEGGYKTYRTYVREQLQQLPQKFSYRMLCGLTGSGKTHILRKLAQSFQVLDLEGLANHRGSLLGEEWEQTPTPQPSQKYFDSLFLQQLQNFDSARPVWIEAESNKIGRLYLPQALWEQMKQATVVEIQLPQAVRVQFLLSEYSHLISHPEVLKTKLQRLKSRYGREKIEEWYRWIDGGEWHTLVGDLLVSHYDPTYRQSMVRYSDQLRCAGGNRPIQKFTLPDLSEPSIASLIKSLMSDES